MKIKTIRFGYKEMAVPVYDEQEILDAIKKEGLGNGAWGYKTPSCIWVYVDGQENEDVWEDIKPSITGIEPCNYYDPNKIEFVNYYIIEKIMKEIHFYTNLTNDDQTSEWDLDTMCVDYYTSNEAIENPDERIVKTTQLCLLRNAWDYIDRGDRVFIHNGSEVFEVLEGKYENTDKEIRRGMDMSRLLIGGTFGKIY